MTGLTDKQIQAMQERYRGMNFFELLRSMGWRNTGREPGPVAERTMPGDINS